MDSRFNIGDFVMYKGKVYIVKSVVLMNPNIINDPFVCGLVSADKPNDFNQLMVREGLLKKVDYKGKAAKVLYGD